MIGHPPKSTLFPYTTLFRSTKAAWCEVACAQAAGRAAESNGWNWGEIQQFARGGLRHGCARRPPASVSQSAACELLNFAPIPAVAFSSASSGLSAGNFAPRCFRRSEERRVGKKGRLWWVPDHLKK